MIALLMGLSFTCNQIVSISERIIRNVSLTEPQRFELFKLVQKEAPQCKIYYDRKDRNQPIKQGVSK